MTRRKRPSTAIVGAGRLASAIAPAMAAAGYRIVTIASRRIASARRLARRIHGARATSNAAAAVADATLVLLAVPDRAIEPVARSLARETDGWERRNVLHHAGAYGTDTLRALAGCGAGVAVLHPLQSLGPRTSVDVLRGSHARIEGDRRGKRIARQIAVDLGLVPLPLRARLGAGDRSLYHTAASLVSNDVVALLAAATDLLTTLGLSRRRALEALLPLTAGTLEQVGESGIERAMTGPVVRGDFETAERQIRVLRRRSKSVAEAHRALSRVLADLARTAGTLTAEQRTALRSLLDDP